MQLSQKRRAGVVGTKADIWEGGHRVPLIVQWLGRLPAAVVETPVELTDIFGTIAETIGVPLPTNAAEDSFSFLSTMLRPGLGQTARPFLVHHSIRGTFALREQDWVYIETRGSGGFSRLPVVEPKTGEASGQLYNLRTDLEQTQNVFLAEPERVKHLESLLKSARTSSGLRALPAVAPARK